MTTLQPSRAPAIRTGQPAGLDVLREQLMSRIAPSLTHTLRGLLNYLVTKNLRHLSCDPARALRDAGALIRPIAQERRISVKCAACPARFPVRSVSGEFVAVLACAAMDVLKDVADGGDVLFEAESQFSGARIIVSGGPSLIYAAQPGALPVLLDEVVTAFGGSKGAVPGAGYSFELPVSAY